MDFFISNAYAQAGGQQDGPVYANLIFIVILFVVFYFLLIRPQQKRAKEHKSMVDNLAKGDEIVTNGGLLGKITKVGENFMTVEIAEGTVIRVQRNAVSTVMPKGTIKSS